MVSNGRLSRALRLLLYLLAEAVDPVEEAAKRKKLDDISKAKDEKALQVISRCGERSSISGASCIPALTAFLTVSRKALRELHLLEML